jgi:flavin prenyltransferase
MTGASGAVYGVRLLDELIKRDYKVSLLISDPGKLVLEHEMGISVNDIVDKSDQICHYPDDDLMAPICSGSHVTSGMIIIPCSMATLGAVANGISSSLIERTADVMLKESRELVVVPRETPLNHIHLKNMLALQEAGAKIVPAMPAFYSKPKTIADIIDFVVGKVMDVLGIEHDLFDRWDGE